MTQKCFFIYLLFFTFGFSFSQTVITGHIHFENNAQNAQVLATVLLKDLDDNTVAYAFSDSKNQYELQTDGKGKFTLVYSALSYETKTLTVEISDKDKAVTKDISLKYEPVELNEVIVESSRPTTVRNDTIVFDAKSFAQGNEQVVEDLLRKIPGLNVTEDGKIKVGNQEIEKVMIEGDDLFEKGYTLLTKNMPVHPISKIELYQNYSNNRHLKGIENSDKVALNLTLKEGSKRQWFGNTNLGYGLASANRYEVRGNLMNFGKKAKYYFLANLNNIGIDAVGDINDLIRPQRYDEPASIGDNQTARVFLSFAADTPNLKQKRTSLNNAELLSLNSIFPLSEKVKLKTLLFLHTDENNYFRNSFQSYWAGTSNFENTEDFKGRKKQVTGFGKIDLTYDIAKNQTFEYTGKFNNANERNSSGLQFNSDFLSERLQGENQLLDHKAVYTNKFAENKVLLLSGRYINEKTPQRYSVNQFIFDELFAENANNTKQYSQNHMQFAGIEAHLMDRKKNGDLLEVKIGNQLRIDALLTRFELYEDQNSIAMPSDYQNDMKYLSNDLYLSAKYRFKLGKFNLLTQSEFHQFYNQFENKESSKHESPFFMVPKIGLDWTIDDKNKLMTSYTYTTTNSGVLDLYSGFVQTGFRSFAKGLADFNQLNASSALLNYTYGNWGDNTFANSFIFYSKNNDFYSSNSYIAQNYSQSEKIIIKDREFFSFTSYIDQYFKTIRSNLKITLGGTKSNFKNIVNNSGLREVKNISAEYGFEMRSGFKGLFNYHLGSRWNYNKVTSSIENSFTDTMSFVDLLFRINPKLNFQLQTERYFFGSLEKDSNKYYFLDLEGRYVVKENKLSFSISGNNLFDTKTFRNYSISDINISKTEYRLQSRYVLLRMEYRF